MRFTTPNDRLFRHLLVMYGKVEISGPDLHNTLITGHFRPEMASRKVLEYVFNCKMPHLSSFFHKTLSPMHESRAVISNTPLSQA
jgi:hypothetical protein